MLKGNLHRAEFYLSRIEQILKNYPEFALLNLPDGWIELQKEIIRELRGE